MGDVSKVFTDLGVPQKLADGIEEADTIVGFASNVVLAYQAGVSILQAVGILQNSKTTTLDDLKADLDDLKNLIVSGFEKLEQAAILEDWKNTSEGINHLYSDAVSAYENAVTYSLSPKDPNLIGLYGNAITDSLNALNEMMPPSSQEEFSSKPLWNRLTDGSTFYSDVWNGDMRLGGANNTIKRTVEYRLQLPAFVE